MKTHKEDATHRTSVFQRRSLTVVLALAVAVWVGAAGVSLAVPPPPGVCCHQGSCLEAIDVGGGWYMCNGVVKWGRFGGSCQGHGACYDSDGTCEWRDGYCCYDILFVPGEACEDPVACCDADVYGVCWLDPQPLCLNGGDYPAGEPNCSNDPCDIRTCCLPVPGPYGDFCDILYFSECMDESGEPQAQGAPWCGDPTADPDNDDVIDPCDNCPDDYNPNQEDQDGDDWGDVCDNCPEDDNPSQTNSDNDSHGDACDNCDFAGNEGQENCDGDGAGDACDGDIDDDGVPNAVDLCDYTPLYLPVETGLVNPFRGTVRAYLDGDCDVDADDEAILQGYLQYGESCVDGEDKEGPLYSECDSCCGPGGGQQF